MKSFNNRNADQRVLIFLIFAIGYIVLVELVSLLGSSLERRWAVAHERQRPLRRPRAAHAAAAPDLHGRDVLALVALVPPSCGGCSTYRSARVRPVGAVPHPGVRHALAQGLLKTLQMASRPILLAVVFGVIFGIGKLSEHTAASLAVAGWSSSSSEPCRCC